MRIGIGLGRGEARAAAVAAARQAKASVPSPKLALAFGGIKLDQAAVHAGLCSELDPAVLIGGSSYAEITPAGVTRDSVAVLLLDWDGAPARFASRALGADPRATGLELAAPLGRGDADTLGLYFSSVHDGRNNETLGALREALGPVPVFGGLCCGDYDLGMDHPAFWTNYQYCGPELATRGSRLALLPLPEACRLSFAFEHGWKPVAPPVTLTRCRGEEVFEVDGVPVLDYYRQFLGEDHADDFFRLLIQRYGFAVSQGGERPALRLPVAVDCEKGSVRYFPADELQGRRVQLIQASRRDVIGGARDAAARCREALGGREPALVLAISCCARHAILHSRVELELEAVRKVFGPGVPIFGCYAGGEVVPFRGSHDEARAADAPPSNFHTTTITLMALAAPVSARPAAAPALAPEPADWRAEAERLRALLAGGERILDDTEAFLSNLSRKTVRDSEQLRRQNEVIHRYTPHAVFDEVGREVARGRTGLTDAEFNGCFLFMDVKGFTSYSEEHRPPEVVSALNRILGPATEAVYASGGDVDKYIGDCIFASFPDAPSAVEAASAVLRHVKALQEQGHPFTVRIGINAGRAVRANVGSDLRREYTFIGDAVNLAQRLESNCAPGRMLLAEEVYRAAAGRTSNAERRELKVKGKKAAVAAFECDPL